MEYSVGAVTFVGRKSSSDCSFKILGITDRQNSSLLRTKKYQLTDSPKYNDLNARSVIRIGDSYIPMYARLLIEKAT